LSQALKQAPDYGGEHARAAVARALGRLGDARAIPMLVGVFMDWHDGVRGAGIDGFISLGAAQALPALSETVAAHKHSWARSHAAEALGRLGDARAVPTLIAALDDAEWLVRTSAAEALGVLRAREAVTALGKHLLEEHVGWRAAEALKEIGDEAAIPALVDALGRARKPSEGSRIADVLGGFGARGTEALEALLARRSLTKVQRECAENALEDARGPAPRAAAPAASARHDERRNPAPGYTPTAGERRAEDPAYEAALLDAHLTTLQDGRPLARIDAAKAIGSLTAGPLTATLTAPLARALRNDGAWGVRAAAATALGTLACHGAAEVLVRALPRESIESVRRAISDALVRHGGTAADPLARLMNDANAGDEMRARAASMLGHISAASPHDTSAGAKAASMALVAALGSRSGAVRTGAAEALASHADGACTIEVGRWMELLDAKDDRVVAAAARALGAHGDGAIGLLAEIATNTSVSRGAQIAACAALAQIGGQRAASTLSKLLASSQENNSAVATAAAAGIARLVEEQMNRTPPAGS
jgi:HEAT repeat protein